MRKKKVLVIGDINVDLIFDNVKDQFRIGAEILANDFSFNLGGSASIFASNLASLGVNVSFLGCIGKDLFGRYILDTLTSNGVNCTHIMQIINMNSGITVAHNYLNNRAAITHLGSMSLLDYPAVRNLDLSDFDHIHISSIFLLPSIKKDILQILDYINSHNISISIDPQFDPQNKWDIPLEEILQNIDIFLPNETEYQSLMQKHLIKNTDGRAIICIKKGENGATCIAKGIEYHSGAFKSPYFIDAIGAGDSFDAGFIAKYLENENLIGCLEFACLMGALNTTERGGTTAFKDLSSIKTKTEQLFNYKKW